MISKGICQLTARQILKVKVKNDLKVIPGRVSLLVTLFLSLTALLVSTISSSPEVTQFPVVVIHSFKESLCLGVSGTYCSDFLGARPLPVHIRSNNRLRCSAHSHPLPHGEVQPSWGGEGSREKSANYWQEDAFPIFNSLPLLQYPVLAHIPPKSKLKKKAKNQKELLDINDTVVFKLLNSKYNLLIFAFKLFLTLVGLVISKILQNTRCMACVSPSGARGEG